MDVKVHLRGINQVKTMTTIVKKIFFIWSQIEFLLKLHLEKMENKRTHLKI